MPIKTVQMVMFLSDVENLGFSEDTIRHIKDRLVDRYSFGTNLQEDYVVVYPHIVAFEMKTEDKIIRKLNYTTMHEMIHGLLADVERNTEETCHACTMLLLQDSKSNCSGLGHNLLFRLIHKDKIEIEIEGDSEEEVKFEEQKTNAARNLSRMRLAQHHELTGL